jgi:hypothetical protein
LDTKKIDRSPVALSKQNFALVTKKDLEVTNPVLAAGVYPKMTQAIQELACASQLSNIIFSPFIICYRTGPICLLKSNLKNEKYRKVLSLFESVLASY